MSDVALAAPGTPCGRCGSPLERGDIRCAVCALPCVVGDAGAPRMIAEVLRCDGCGAALEYDVRVQAPRCAFCGSIAHLERTEDPVERAEVFLPFRVDRATAQASLRRWLSSLGWFRPTDLATAATMEQLTPLWWVAWTFDCEALVSWTADSNYGAGRSGWAPHSGQFPVSLRAVLISASRGLTRFETQRLAPRFDITTAAPQPQAVDGAVIERFDVQRSAARGIVADAVRQTAAAHARPHVPGSHVRNIHVSPLLRSFTTRRLALPSYVLAYRYRGELFRAVVHGQDPSVVLADAPYSRLKILAVAGGVLGVLLLGCLVLALIFAISASRSGQDGGPELEPTYYQPMVQEPSSVEPGD